MTWRDAFLRQARSEWEVYEYLNEEEMVLSHQLHYLQMASEKLAKGLMSDPRSGDPPPRTHRALVRMLQTVAQRPEIRRRLGFSDAGVFRQYIVSLLPLASQLERLAPASAAMHEPNPEYPWAPSGADSVVAPVDFDFPEFYKASPQFGKLVRLLERLLRETV